MPTPLGERVRELRNKAGLTLEEMAKRVGSSKSYMWEIENKDVARPSAEKLQKISEVLKTTVSYLLVAENETELDAADTAFFRKYKNMSVPAKETLRKLQEVLDDEDE